MIMNPCPFTRPCHLECPLWMDCEDNRKKDEVRYSLWETAFVMFLIGVSIIALFNVEWRSVWNTLAQLFS
jgi:hypothetical protein